MPTSARQPPGPGQSADRTHLHPHRTRNRVHRPPALRISHPAPDAPCAPLRYVRSTVVLLMSIPSGPMWASAPTMGAFSDGASNAAACMGGYKIRPYGPTPGFLVGAACMAARTDSRLPLGFDGPPSKGRCPHRPASPRVRGSPPNRTHLHPHRRGGLYIRPEPGASATGPSYIAPGSGRAMRAPTECAFGDGASDASVRTGGHLGHPYNSRPAFS